MIDLYNIYKNIVSPYEENKTISEMGQIVADWNISTTPGAFPLSGQSLMKKMADEVEKNIENYNLVPNVIRTNKEYTGKIFYDLMRSKIDQSTFRKKVGRILDKDEKTWSEKDKATINLYRDINNVKDSQETRDFFNDHDEISLARKYVKDISDKYGYNIISEPEALKEMGKKVVEVPEAFEVVPISAKEYVGSSSEFYAAIYSEKNKLIELAEDAKKAKEVSPEQASAISIVDYLKEYEKNIMLDIEKERAPERDIDVKNDPEEIKNVFKNIETQMPFDNSQYYEDQFIPEIDAPDDEGYYEYLDEYLSHPEQEAPQQEEPETSFENIENKTEATIEEKQQEEKVENLIDTTFNMDEVLNKDQNIESRYDYGVEQEEIPFEEREFTTDNFFELAQNWEVLKVGASTGYLPEEIQEALAKIVATDQNYYVDVPSDITEPTEDNKVFYKVLDKEIRKRKDEPIDIIKSDIKTFKDNVKEKIRDYKNINDFER